MTQLEFTLTRAGETQCERILAELERCHPNWVPMPQFARVGAGNDNGFCMVHSRIADLRKQGRRIDQRSSREGNQCHSEYRLNNSPF